MMRRILSAAVLALGAWQSSAAQTTTPTARERTEISAVALVPQWGTTDILGGVEALYLVTRRGAGSFEVGGAVLRAFPDKESWACAPLPGASPVCDIRGVDRVYMAHAGLRLTGPAVNRWQFAMRTGPSFYTASVVENRQPTGDNTSGIMFNGAVGVTRQVARSHVHFELRGAILPAAMSGRSTLYGARLGIGF